jgi:type IV secretion system protein VirD4
MSGVIVGKYQGSYLVFDGQQFILLAAPTRSGKGVAIVVPNLLNFDDSVVVLDLKLENFRYTSLFRENHGQKVYLFAPFSEDCMSHRWNVFDSVSTDRNFRVGDVMAIGQILYPSDCDPKDKFWNDNARNLFVGIVLYLLETPELPCTLGEVLRQSSGKGLPIKDHLQNILIERSNGENPLSDECLDALSRFLSSPENTLGSILSTFNAPLLIFANPIVDAATSASDFDFNDLRKHRISIYFGVQPNRLSDAAILVNLFFSQLINLNLKELPENNPDLKHQCLLVMDEFTAIGKVGIIASANSFIAGYNIRLLTIIQSISQLESKYGKDDTRTLVTNHALQIIYPPREQKDANEVSESLGYLTEKSISSGISRPRTWGSNNGSTSENTSDQRRALMMPQELKELGKDKEIILLENCKPIMCQKARYFDDHVFLDRLKSVSPSLAALDHTPMRKLFRKAGFSAKARPSEKQLKHAAFVLREMSSAVPRLDIDLHKAKMENRTRVAEAGEQIDLAKLVADVSDLPTIDNPENPSEEQVAVLVDAFFSQLDWVDEDTGEVGEAPTGEVVEMGDSVAITETSTDDDGFAAGGLIEAGDADEPPDDYFNEIGTPDSNQVVQGTSASSGGEIDLADLDVEVAEQPV